MKTVIENKTSKEHFQKYEDLAKALGVHALASMVPLVGYNTLQDAFEKDKNLNNIPLPLWDNMDFSVRHLVGMCPKEKFLEAYHKHSRYEGEERQKKIWSLCETVCVLKHVAIYHIIGATPIFE